MGVKILDEVNLQNMGMSTRNIAALREVSTRIVGSVLETTEIEKLVLTSDEDSQQDELLRLLRQADHSIMISTESKDYIIENKQKLLEQRLLLETEQAKNVELEIKFNRLQEQLLLLSENNQEAPNKDQVIFQLLDRIELLEEAMKQVIVRDGDTGNELAIDTNGAASIVQEKHSDSSFIHADIAVTGGTNIDFILVDLSDTTNYKHSNTNNIILEEIYIEVDAEVNADYVVEIDFLANVGAADSDVYEITHVEGTKTVGQQKEVIRKFYPNGPKCNSANMLTTDITLNDTTVNTATSLKSTYIPGAASTAPGDGDLILRINAGAGGANTNFNVEINLTYRTD